MAPVVADASALLALSKLDRLELLRDLFQQVSIPPTVSHEISARCRDCRIGSRWSLRIQ
jgi:predicted nucleic acid-binding protein